MSNVGSYVTFTRPGEGRVRLQGCVRHLHSDDTASVRVYSFNKNHDGCVYRVPVKDLTTIPENDADSGDIVSFPTNLKTSPRADVFSEADVKRLQKIRQIFEDHKKTIRRRKWRDSEKAMSLANIQQDIDALDHALAILDPK